MAEAEPLIPGFETVVDKFVRLAVSRGFPPNMLWISAEDLVLLNWKGERVEFVRKGDPAERKRRVEAAYHNAATRKVGMAFEARAKTERWTICQFYVSPDQLGAELWANRDQGGITYSVASDPKRVVLVENNHSWGVLRLWQRRIRW